MPRLLIFPILIVLAISACTGQVLNRVSLSDVTGYYLIDRRAQQYFPDIIQFLIDSSDSMSRQDRTIGYLVFFSDTTLVQSDSSCSCPFINWTISPDSLKFSTGVCFEEYYEFSGRWLLPLGQFEQDGDRPVLEGTLTRYVNSQVKQSKKIFFYYSAGC